MSGANALFFASKLTHQTTFKPRYATLGFLYDQTDEPIDQAIVLYFQAPFSFTGEDVVEFQCHGGSIVAHLVLETLLACGVRLALPGEFSKRAFLNGKMDLSKAEAIASLIESRSVDAVKILMRQIKGELKDFVHRVRESLVEMLAFVEVNIDYAEEDLPLDLLQTIEQKLLSLQGELLKIYESSKRRQGLMQGFKVAIVGKPNVGKSSLLNKLLSYERAIISDIAGTTRDTIEEELRIGTHLVKIIDTAGIRQANDVVEKIGIERSLQAVQEAEIIIAMFDNSRVCDGEDEAILELLHTHATQKHVINVLNKADLPKAFECPKLGDSLLISCQDSAETIIQKVQQILDIATNDDTMMLTSLRQLDAVKKAYEAISKTTPLLNQGELELFAFHINEAIEAIASITNPFERHEILDKMFGNFCLGK